MPAFNLSCISRMIGIGPRFHNTLIGLLDLGYKCRIRLPLFISAGFVLCHFFSVYLPTVEINVEVIEDQQDDDEDEDYDEDDELSLGSSDSESEADLAVVVEILNGNRRD